MLRIFIIFMFLYSSGFAQEKYLELLKSDLNTKKVYLLTETMNLNDQQGEKFWPIYREYDFKASAITDETFELIKDFAKNYQIMTDQKADEIIIKLFDLKDKASGLKKEYYNKIKNEVGVIIAAKFVQVSNQIDQLINLKIASQLPLIGEDAFNEDNIKQ